MEVFKKIREKLQELCEQTYYNSVNGNRDEGIRNNAYHNAIEIVNQVEQEYNNGWIPCSERLPKIYDTYLVVVKLKYEWETEWEYHTDVADFTFEGGYIEGWNTFNDWNEGQECHVIAWQPLPQPYNEKITI